jgi:hypothetical protein
VDSLPSGGGAMRLGDCRWRFPLSIAWMGGERRRPTRRKGSVNGGNGGGEAGQDGNRRRGELPVDAIFGSQLDDHSAIFAAFAGGWVALWPMWPFFGRMRQFPLTHPRMERGGLEGLASQQPVRQGRIQCSTKRRCFAPDKHGHLQTFPVKAGHEFARRAAGVGCGELKSVCRLGPD